MRSPHVLSFCAVVAVGIGAAPPVQNLNVFEIEPLADGVYAALVVDRPDAYAFANSLVVIGDEGVLVVDTQQSPQAAQELIRLIGDLTDLPVRWVVNTHWHGDHVYGNVAYRDAFPGVRFLAHPATVLGMREEGAAQRAEELATLPETIEARERWLDEGVLPDGRELTPDLREQVVYSLDLRRDYLASLRELVIVEPEGAIEARHRIDLGNRVVELIPLAPAHTAGDLGVWVPDGGVLAVGDLLEEAPPWIDGAASLAGWAEALDRIASEEASLILPSHGGVQRDSSLLAQERALFGELARLSTRAAAESWDSDRVAREITLESHRSFLMGLGLDEAGFADWRDRAVAKAVDQARTPSR